MVVPGLQPARWRESAGWTDAAWIDALTEWTTRLREVDAGPLAERARLPLGEVIASPFGLRAVALGVAEGATTVHREVDRVLEWPGPMKTSGSTDDDAHGLWERGVLRVGKYQGFLQDAPHATFDPSHVAKWGPHEMMHRACRFFWRADATPFEHYLGARLNELLPVALWYGADQVARLDETRFVRADAQREARVEDAHWREEPEHALRARITCTLPNLRRFFAHVESELATIDEEHRTGRCIATPRRFADSSLDASSDALAYVVGHGTRLRGLADALEGTPAFSSIDEYRAFVDTRIDALLFGDLAIDFDVVDAKAQARVAWNARLRRALGGDEEDVEADGLQAYDLGQLAEGIEQSLPVAFAWLESHRDEWLEDFVDSPAFTRRASLSARLAEFLGASLEGELATLDGLLLAARPDPRVVHLGQPSGRKLVRSEGFTLHRFEHDVLAAHGEPSEARAILVGASADATVAVPLPDHVVQAWEDLVDGAGAVDELELDEEWREILQGAGALTYCD